LFDHGVQVKATISNGVVRYFTNDENWTAITSTMPLEKRDKELLQSLNLPRHMTELYVTLKGKIKDEIMIAKEEYIQDAIPFNQCRSLPLTYSASFSGGKLLSWR